MTHATEHFRQRVRERIGGDIDPDFLALGIVWAIDNDRRDLVQYVGRVTKQGLRAFRFRVPGGRRFVALVNTTEKRCITVLRAEGQLMRHHRAGGPISME
jgi:hypothetical protein